MLSPADSRRQILFIAYSWDASFRHSYILLPLMPAAMARQLMLDTSCIS